MTIEDAATAGLWLRAGHDPERISELLGCSVDAVLRHREAKSLEYMPTPAAIAAQCAEFRRHWSDDEYRERAGLLGWTVPGLRHPVDAA